MSNIPTNQTFHKIIANNIADDYIQFVRSSDKAVLLWLDANGNFQGPGLTSLIGSTAGNNNWTGNETHIGTETFAGITGTGTIGTIGLGPTALAANNAWTGAATHAGTEKFNNNVIFRGPTPVIDIRSYGAVCDGATDDSAAINAAMAAAPASGAIIYFPPTANGTFCNNEITSTNQNLVLAGAGKYASKLSFSGANGTFTDAANMYFPGGGLTALPALSVSPTAGTQTLTFASNPTLVQGSVIVIWNPTSSSYSGFRANYYAGEYCVVQSVAANVVTLSEPLFASYMSGSVNMYVMTSPTHIQIRDMQIVGQGSVGGNSNALILIIYGQDVRVTNCALSNSNYNNCYLQNCYSFTIDGNYSYMNTNAGAGTSYACVIGNSQSGLVTNNEFLSTREAFDTGGTSGVGAVPCRQIIVSNNRLRATFTQGQTAALSTHGNTEYCTYSNNICDGVTWSGNHNKWINNTVYQTSDESCFLGSELSGFDHVIQGNTMYATAIASSRGVFLDVGGNSINVLNVSTTAGGLLNFSDNTCIYQGAADDAFIPVFILNRGSTVTNLDIDFSNNRIEGAVGTIGNIPSQIGWISGVSFNSVNVKNNFSYGCGIQITSALYASIVGNTVINSGSHGIFCSPTITTTPAFEYVATGNVVLNPQKQGIFIGGNASQMIGAVVIASNVSDNYGANVATGAGIDTQFATAAYITANRAGSTAAHATNPFVCNTITTLYEGNNNYYGTGAPASRVGVTTFGVCDSSSFNLASGRVISWGSPNGDIGLSRDSAGALAVGNATAGDKSGILKMGTMWLTAATPTTAAGQVGLGTTTTTSATAGANGAVPAQVVGYLSIDIAGTKFKIPYYAV